MLAFAVWRVAIEHSRRRSAGMRPPVAKIDPEAAGLGLAVAGSQHRHGRVVRMDDGACHDVTADPFSERLHKPSRLTNPIGQRCAVKLHAVAGVNLSLAVKRQVIAELRDQHMGKQARILFCAMLALRKGTLCKCIILNSADLPRGRPEPPVRLTINVMAENNQQAIECAKERLVSVGLKNNADMVRVRENGGSIIWEGR